VMFGQDRTALRRMYHDAWAAHLAGRPLSPLDAQIVAVIEAHPEYQPTVAANEADRDYVPEGGESNPYLHMGLHLGLRDQVATDRPAGIRKVFEDLCRSTGDAHAAEHRMIDCLAETLWQAQRDNAPPDEHEYLERLRRL